MADLGPRLLIWPSIIKKKKENLNFDWEIPCISG